VSAANYLELNRQAYDSTAHEFEQKIELRRPSDERLVETLTGYFEDKFNPANVLELGPGSGYMAKLLTDRGHRVTAIDFSPRMAEVAARTAPEARVIVGNFLEHDFGGEKFDVALGVAFIHLLQEHHAKQAVSKISQLLVDDGVLLLTTTLHDRENEGYEQKANFAERPLRFRRQYTELAFRNLIEGEGFIVTDTFINPDSEGIADKNWLCVVASKR
jgi:SAM-dependent methyltransferase